MAAYVGIGMALTIGVSFLLIIPIEPLIWLFALPSGVMIGYYANARSNRRLGPWYRILANAVFAAAITGLTAAVLLLAIKGLFFFADNGYRDPGLGGSLVCQSGADCVYQRYLDADRGAEMASIVSDTVPIWLSLMSTEFIADSAMPRSMNAGFVTTMSSPTSLSLIHI